MAMREIELKCDYAPLEDREEPFIEDIEWILDNLRLSEVIEGYAKSVRCFTTISKYLVSGSDDNSIRLWNTQTKQQLAIFEGHNDDVVCLTSIKGYLASGSEDKTIRLWSIGSGEQVAVLRGHTEGVRCLAVMEHYLVSGSKDKTIRLWNPESKEEVGVLEGHTDDVNSLITIDDYLASASQDTTIRLWSTQTWQQIALFEGHTDGVESLAVVKDSLVSGSKDKTVRVWSIKTRQQLAILRGHTDNVNCLIKVDDYLVSGSKDKTIKLWNLRTKEEVATLEEHTDSIKCLAITNGHLVSGSKDNTIRVWSTSEKEKSTTLEGCFDSVRCLATTFGYLASGFDDSTIKLWNPKNKQEVAVLKGHTSNVLSLTAFGEYLASGSSDNTIRLWNTSTKQEVAVFEGHTDWVRSLTTINGYLASGSEDKTIRLWSIESRQQVAVLRGHTEGVRCLKAIQGYLVSGSSDNTIRLWSIETGQQVEVLEGHTDDVNSLTTINGYLASGSEDSTLRLWDVRTRQEVAILEGHTKGVECVAAMNEHLISASKDKTVRLWNIETKQPVAILEDHTDNVNCLTTTSEYLVSGSKDKTIRLTMMNCKYRLFPGSDLGIHHFKKLANSSALDYNKSINEITIMPQRINILHVLARQGKDKLLEKALEEGCYFLESRDRRTPLSISLEKGNKRCTEVILKYVGSLENKIRQAKILSLMHRDLPSILETNSIYLGSVCEAATFSFVDSIRTSELPQYFKTQVPVFNPSDYSSELEDVRMGSTQLKFNFLEGSESSLKLLKALESTESSECLCSDLVQTLVSYKWSKFKLLFWVLAFLNLLNVVLIMGITFSDTNSTRQLLTRAFLFNNSFFMLFEAIQLFSLKLRYFYSTKNYLDLLRILLGYLWGVVSLSSEFSNLNSTSILTLVTSLLFWVEGVSAFKLIESTRYYTWLIREVIKDIRGFLGILVYFVVAYCSIIGTSISSSFLETFKTSYDLLLGELDRSDFDDIQWVVFVLGSLLNLIIMLNLLISIISESFAKIVSERKESDTRIRLELIIEVENCLFWKRNQQELAYLWFIEDYQGEETTQELEIKFNKLYKETQVIKNKIEENSKKLEAIMQVLKQS